LNVDETSRDVVSKGPKGRGDSISPLPNIR
jgi:hypothetical protein